MGAPYILVRHLALSKGLSPIDEVPDVPLVASVQVVGQEAQGPHVEGQHLHMRGLGQAPPAPVAPSGAGWPCLLLV